MTPEEKKAAILDAVFTPLEPRPDVAREPIIDLSTMPPAGVWRGGRPVQADHIVDANKMVQEPMPRALEHYGYKVMKPEDHSGFPLAATVVPARPVVEMSAEDELGLCVTIMVMEELQGLFGAPRRPNAGFAAIQMSWEAWVHGLLSSRV
tara:strand:- start:1158 stop:1607 length:450 start_codon:yes stop_codon:yes gene_type:complete